MRASTMEYNLSHAWVDRSRAHRQGGGLVQQAWVFTLALARPPRLRGCINTTCTRNPLLHGMADKCRLNTCVRASNVQANSSHAWGQVTKEQKNQSTKQEESSYLLLGFLLLLLLLLLLGLGLGLRSLLPRLRAWSRAPTREIVRKSQSCMAKPGDRNTSKRDSIEHACKNTYIFCPP